MLRNLTQLTLAACAALLSLVAATAQGAEDEGVASNVYMAGADVRIDRGVEGDVVAAAGRINVDEPIVGDAVFAGGSVEVRAPIGEDLRAAGGVVMLSSRVHGEALLAGLRIVLGPGSELHGPAWIAGSHVSIGGRALSGLKVYGRRVLVLGEVRGPLEVSAGRLEIHRSAQIHGDLTYSSGEEISIEPGARIAGTVTRTSSALDFADHSADAPLLKALRPLLLCGLLAAGIVLFALFPRFTLTASQTLAHAPVKSLGLGVALFFSVPPVILLLVITIIGIPIAIALAAFHAIALLAAYLVTAHFIAERLAHALQRKAPRRAWRFVFLAVAIVLLSLAGSIPHAGVWLLLLALIAGLGGMVLQAFNRYNAPVKQAADAWPSA